MTANNVNPQVLSDETITRTLADWLVDVQHLTTDAAWPLATKITRVLTANGRAFSGQIQMCTCKETKRRFIRIVSDNHPQLSEFAP